MNAELRVIRAIGHMLPPVPHATALINRVLKPLYLRKPRDPVVADVWGMMMFLDPAEAVDGGLLFYPQLYNRIEMRWLESHIRPDDVFADVGAYIGAFTLRAARLAMRVIAIEASPHAFAILSSNIERNGLLVDARNVGVSDKNETLQLHIQGHKNAGGSSFVVEHDGNAVDVVCQPLADVAPQVDVMKIDIEGMEERVLRPYFEKCLPRVLIMEAWDDTEALRLCLDKGYQIEARSDENVLLVR
jgi:FkbM family methyltransferase